MIKIKVSMYFPYFWQASGLLFGTFPWFLLSKVVSSELDPLLAGEGVVNWQFRPLRMVQLSPHLVCRFPRGPFTKLYRWFQSTVPVVACGGLKSWRYEWVKSVKNDVCWLSEVVFQCLLVVFCRVLGVEVVHLR